MAHFQISCGGILKGGVFLARVLLCYWCPVVLAVQSESEIVKGRQEWRQGGFQQSPGDHFSPGTGTKFELSACTGGQAIFVGEPAIGRLFLVSSVCRRTQLTGAARTSPLPGFSKADGLWRVFTWRCWQRAVNTKQLEFVAGCYYSERSLSKAYAFSDFTCVWNDTCVRFLPVNKCGQSDCRPKVDLLGENKAWTVVRVGCGARICVSQAWMEFEEHSWVSPLIHSCFYVSESKNTFLHLSCMTSGRHGLVAASFLLVWFESKRFWGFSRLCCSWSLQVNII